MNHALEAVAQLRHVANIIELSVINWSESTILDRESDGRTRWIKEAVHTRKEGRRSMNRDDGSYTLSHTYD